MQRHTLIHCMSLHVFLKAVSTSFSSPPYKGIRRQTLPRIVFRYICFSGSLLRLAITPASTVVLLMISVIWPSNALAIQVHAGSEGFYAHQMAHVFFLAAMIFLFYILFRHPLGHGKAWTYLKMSLLFFSIWNVNALITHSLELTIPLESLVIKKGILPYYFCASMTFEKWAYYVGKFDHILCVPAMFFLTMALKTFCQEAERRTAEKKEVMK